MGFLKLMSCEPTVFFVWERDGLKQLVELSILNKGEETDALLEIGTDSETYLADIGRIGAGPQKCEVLVPDIRQRLEVRLRLYTGKELQDEASVEWKPERHWLVYVIQRCHHAILYGSSL
ncbi:MAG: hypothetical protein ACETWE_09020 [Candidatus Bathyarchaeia archaeon]